MNKNIRQEMMRFVVVGVAATAIHYGVYFVLRYGIDAHVAYAVGYFVSFVFNYVMSARFTFKKTASVKNGVGFGLAHVCNFLLQMGLLSLFLWLGVSEAIAPLPVYCIAVPVNFMMVRLVFRKLK